MGNLYSSIFFRIMIFFVSNCLNQYFDLRKCIDTFCTSGPYPPPYIKTFQQLTFTDMIDNDKQWKSVRHGVHDCSCWLTGWCAVSSSSSTVTLMMNEQKANLSDLTAENQRLITERGTLQMQTEVLRNTTENLNRTLEHILNFNTFPVSEYCPGKSKFNSSACKGAILWRKSLEKV